MKYILSNKNSLEIKKCYICFNNCYETFCNCELQSVHQTCINSLIKNNIKLNCPSCNQEYKISLYVKIYSFLYKCIALLFDIFKNITEYNLYSGTRWEDEY